MFEGDWVIVKDVNKKRTPKSPLGVYLAETKEWFLISTIVANALPS